MSTVQDLMEKRAEIEEMIKQAQKDERKEDLKTVRSLCRKHGFTYSMVKNSLARGRRKATTE